VAAAVWRKEFLVSSPAVRCTSEALLDFARDFKGDRVHLRELDKVLEDRSFGFLLLIFALPNVPPLAIPALSTVTGIPLAVVALQLMWGMPRPHLPQWLANWSLPHARFLLLVEKLTPGLRRVERVMRPRWNGLQTPVFERLVGGICLVLAVVLILPIPFGNAPPALGVALIGVGMIGKDGAFMTGGAAIGIAALALVGGVVWALTQAGMLFLSQVVGT
jgi:hypothetical protein